MVDIKRQLDQIIWDKWTKGKKAELKPSGLGWNQDVMPWKAEFKLNAADDQPFVYRADGKYISFKPTGMWWVTPQGKIVIKQGVSTSIGSLVKGKARYANALGAGIGLEASVSQTTWREEVTIDSLASLGAIPANAEFLEIGFEIKTDFDIEGWDKKSELKFNKAIRLSELSKLESIKTWDSHIIPEPKEGEETEASFECCNGFLRVVDDRYYLIKQIPVGYLQQAVYPVITDTIITYGAEYEFNAAADTTFISCAALDATHFVVGYRDGSDAGHGKAKIGVVSSGDEIAYGAEYEFNATNTYPTCAVLDTTHFVVGYTYWGAGEGKAKIGVVTGNVIAYGAEYTFCAGINTTYISCAKLDATHFVVGYRDGAGALNYGKAKIGVVTGNVIAYGSEYTFFAANTTSISCAALDVTHFVVGYADGIGGEGYAKIGVVTGNVIAYGAEYEFNDVASVLTSCAALDTTHFVVGYRGAANHGKAKIGVVSSGDEIAFGAEYTFFAAATMDISCAAFDATHFVVGYQAGAAGNGKSKIGVVTGNAIAYGAEYEFNAVATIYISCAVLDATHFVVGYQDSGGDGYGIARIGSLPEAGLENKSSSMAAKMIGAGLV
ncbi:hypothetical protein ES705_12385 [subsurface metagenome]